MTEESAAGRGREDTGARPGASCEAAHLDRLEDTDDGCFVVRTHTGRYLLDLAHRRLVREPVTLTARGRSLTWTFEVDGLWLPLVKLHECTVGAGMRAVIRIAEQDQPLRTSPVRSICRSDAPPRR